MANADGKRIDFKDFEDLLKIQDVENLQDQLDGKAVIGHTHTIPEVAGLSLALGSKADAIHSHDFTELNDTPTDYSGASLQLVRVKAAEDGLEFIDPASVLAPGSIEVGDPVLKLKRKPAPVPGPGQWLPAWISADVDAANWSILQPFLHSMKSEVVETFVDQFLVVNVSRAANVATLELANTDECNLLALLLYGELLFDCYDPITNTSTPDPGKYAAWAMTIDLPAPIDFIPSGRYELLSIDPVNRLFTIALNGPDQGLTPVTEYIENFPCRKTGTNTVSRWRAVTDASLIMGRIPGLRSLDAVGDHSHSYNNTISGVLPLLFGPGSFNAIFGFNSPQTGAVAAARKDAINRTRSLGGFLYLYGGLYT